MLKQKNQETECTGHKKGDILEGVHRWAVAFPGGEAADIVHPIVDHGN